MYKCDICYKQFKSKTGYKSHVSMHRTGYINEDGRKNPNYVKKTKRGRPPTELDVLRDDWADYFLSGSKEGWSENKLCLDIRKNDGSIEGLSGPYMPLDDRTFNRLAENYPKFKRIRSIGKRYRRDWWEEHGRVNLNNKEFNNGLWAINMQNLQGWSTKNETKKETNVTIKLSETVQKPKISGVVREVIDMDDDDE